MEVRKRRPQETSRGQAASDTVTTSQSRSESVGSTGSIVDGLLAFFSFLVEALRALIYGDDRGLREKEDEDDMEDKSKEELILLGHMDHGRLAVHLRRRPKTTALMLSSDSNDAKAQSSLRHAAAAHAFLDSSTHPRLLE